MTALFKPGDVVTHKTACVQPADRHLQPMVVVAVYNRQETYSEDGYLYEIASPDETSFIPQPELAPWSEYLEARKTHDDGVTQAAQKVAGGILDAFFARTANGNAQKEAQEEAPSNGEAEDNGIQQEDLSPSTAWRGTAKERPRNPADAAPAQQR